MRMFFFGDSNTYGHGLPDCVTPEMNPGPVPSKMGWAYRVATMSNAEYINLASPGSSNIEILEALRYSDVTSNDTVIVQWSYHTRDCILGPDRMRISPWVRNELTEYFYALHTDADLRERTVLAMEHAALWLSHMGARWVFTTVVHESLPDHISDLIHDHMERFNKDKCIDGVHPGLESNEIWANKMMEFLDSEQRMLRLR